MKQITLTKSIIIHLCILGGLLIALVTTVPPPIGYDLKIQLSSGWLKPGGMLIDLLEIIEK